MFKKTITNPGSDNLATTIKVIGLIAFTLWIAHFLHFRELGFYEDDTTIAARALGQDWSFLPQAFQPLLTWVHSRPIGWFLTLLLTFLGDQLGGISGVHIINFFLISCNAYLCYRILRFVTLPSAAIAGALFFCLFPLDTLSKHESMVYGFMLQASLGFAMAAILAYLIGKKWLSYGLIFGSLLTYQTPFLLFSAAPLLPLKKWNWAVVKECLRHVLIMVGMIITVAIIRKMTDALPRYPDAESALKNSSLGVMALRLTTAPLLGTFINVMSLLRAPYQSLISLIRGESSWVIVVVYFLVNLTVLATIKNVALDEVSSTLDEELIDPNVNQPLSIKKTWLKKGVQQILYPTHARLILLGVIFILLSYPIATAKPVFYTTFVLQVANLLLLPKLADILIFVSPYFSGPLHSIHLLTGVDGDILSKISNSATLKSPSLFYGRISGSAHGAAAFGGSVLFAGLYAALLSPWQSHRRRMIAPILLSAYLSLLVGYMFPIQIEAVKFWQYERTFWSQFVKLCPDLDSGPIILVDTGQYGESFPPANQFPRRPNQGNPITSQIRKLALLFTYPPNTPKPIILFGGMPLLRNSKASIATPAEFSTDFKWKQGQMIEIPDNLEDNLDLPSDQLFYLTSKDLYSRLTKLALPLGLTPEQLFYQVSLNRHRLKQEKEQLFWHNPASVNNKDLFKDGLIPLPKSNTIVLKMVDGKLTRLTGSILADGKPFPLKELPATPTPPLPKGVFYDYLIVNDSGSPSTAN